MQSFFDPLISEKELLHKAFLISGKTGKKKNMQELHPEYSRTQPSLSFFPSNLTQSESIPQPRDRQTLWRLSSLDVWFLLVSIAKIMQRYRCCIFHWLWQEPRTLLFIIRGLFVCPRVPVGPWPAPRSTPRGLGARGQDPITPPPTLHPSGFIPAGPPRHVLIGSSCSFFPLATHSVEWVRLSRRFFQCEMSL